MNMPVLAALTVLAGSALMMPRPPAAAQAPPSTEIYLAPLTGAGARVGRPVNISNNPGYDNQPFFLPDSSGLLFSSNRDGRQTDIYRYDIGTKKLTQVTRTADNEYSPTVTPDGRTFTTVRGAEQRLWRFALDDGSDAGLAWAHTGLIGYHAWISEVEIAAFILGDRGEPSTLQIMDLRTGRSDVIESNIGRSLHIRPGRGTLSFVHRPKGQPWLIKELDPRSRQVVTVAPTIDGSEDLAWTPAGAIVMGARSKLFLWTEGDPQWRELADLARSGVTAISRLAVSPDASWIAIVSTPPPAK